MNSYLLKLLCTPGPTVISKGLTLVIYNGIGLIVELVRDLIDVKLCTKFRENLLIFIEVIVYTRSNSIKTAKGHNSRYL